MGKRTKKRIAVILLLSAAALLILLLINSMLQKRTRRVSADLYVKESENIVEFIQSFGWQVESQPDEISEQIIPEEFDDVFLMYNDLQQSQGFDLENYKGKSVKRYSFEIKNYPDVSQKVLANVLVFEEKIIGGDICSVSLDGFMQGFEMNDRGICKKTFAQI